MADREKLIELLNYVGQNVMQFKTGNFIESLAEYLIANGVKIPVLCKDCKHFDMQRMECQCDAIVTDNEGGADFTVNFYLDDFCSYGERRNDNA